MRLLVVPALWLLSIGAPVAVPVAGSAEHDVGFAGITLEDVEAHLLELATAPLEGRDSPSVGLTRAGDYIIERFEAAGLEGAGRDGSFRLGYARDFHAPKKNGCGLTATVEGGETIELVYGTDFVPLPVCTGVATGEAIFAGFGISSKKQKYDDLKGSLKGKVAVILEGEPRHKRKFEGAAVTPDSDIHVKLKNLEQKGVSGVLVVRRRPVEPALDGDGEELEPARLGYRYSWASWNPALGQRNPQVPRTYDFPALEITEEAAMRMLGIDVVAVGESLDKSARPKKPEKLSVEITLSSSIEQTSVNVDNIVGIVRGTDPDLKDEFVVIGAHYDHVGVDVRGRIGFGADDNGSGTCAMIEIAEALAAAGTRRSILACAFSSEEDGLLGSRELARNPPVPRDKIVAMLNFDMVGRGKTGEVIVLGAKRNPDLDKVLKRARKLKSAKVKIVTGKADHLWQRSDHYSFHAEGVPSLFFFESASELDNEDYHTFNDTIDKLDFEKIARTARLAYNTAWILADDDDRPSRPRD